MGMLMEEFMFELVLITCILPVLRCEFTFQCPTKEQWSLRSRIVCNSTVPSYYCILDLGDEKYIELCQDFPSQELIGFRKVFSGNLDGEKCTTGRYQPTKFWTNGSSDCIYQKSFCNDEGQVVHDDGNSILDRKCKCDYRHGFNYVKKPKNSCYCIPSVEDCTCYKVSCPSEKLLSPDYECRSIHNWKTKFNCSVISMGPTVIPKQSIDLSKFTSEGHEPVVSPKYAAISVTFISVLFLVTGVAVILYIFAKRDVGDLSEPTYIYLVPPCDEIPVNIKELQQHEVDKWKQVLQKFVPTRASAAVKESIMTNQCVVITGPPGCGKTVTANYVILYMTESEGYDLMLVCDINDTIKYSKPKGKQLLFIDDIFGKHFIEEHNRDWWGKQNQRVQILLSRNKDLKLIATCRSYVYNLIDDRCLLPFTKICFLSEDICLNLSERRSIGHSYIGDEINGLGDKVLMEFDFFPELCYYCSVNRADGSENVLNSCSVINEHWLEELLNPRMYIKYEIDNLFKHLDIKFILFSLMVISGNSIKTDLLTNENHTDNNKINFLYGEVGLKPAPSKQSLLKYLLSLRGSFVVEENTIFEFKSEKMFSVVTLCISKYIIKSLLKYGKWSVLKDRFTLEQFSKYRATQQCVLIPMGYEHLYFDRLLMDINSGLFWEVFLDTNNSLLDFRNMFLDYLHNHFTCKDFKDDTNRSTVLHAVADQGYDDYVKFFADLDRSRVNIKDKFENTPLHLAARKGHKAVVEALIKRKAFFDATNEKGNTPLHIACEGGHVETVEKLLLMKAAIKQNPLTLDTALHLVCKNGHKQLASLLLQKNAKVNVSDQKGFTPLHFTCRKGHIELCKLLLSYDANINSVDGKIRSPLYHACEMNRLDIVELLLKHNATVNIETKDKKSLLHIACEKGHIKITKQLLELDLKVDDKDLNGNTPLYLASMNGHEEIVGSLLIKHANINVCNNGKNLPIHAASSRGHTKVVECLLDYNTEINCVNKEKLTPLHNACISGHTDIVKHLLKKQKNLESTGTIPISSALNMKDKYGRTPLHIACEKGHINTVELLLDQGADTECLETDGFTIIHIACREGFFEILRLLLEHNTNVNSTDHDLWTPLYAACYENKYDIAKILIERHANVNQANKDGDTPLHQTAACGNDSFTKLLVISGANINQKNKLGETPLWKSAINGHVSVTRYLVQHGAEIDISDRFGNSLETLVRRNNDHVEIVDILSGENETAL